MDPQHQCYLGACCQYRISGPTEDLPNQSEFSQFPDNTHVLFLVSFSSDYVGGLYKILKTGASLYISIYNHYICSFP